MVVMVMETEWQLPPQRPSSFRPSAFASRERGLKWQGRSGDSLKLAPPLIHQENQLIPKDGIQRRVDGRRTRGTLMRKPAVSRTSPHRGTLHTRHRLVRRVGVRCHQEKPPGILATSQAFSP